MNNSKYTWRISSCLNWIAIISAIGGIIYFFLIWLNSTFTVSELEDFSVNTVVPTVLETVNDAIGMPTAVTPPTLSSPITSDNGYNLILIGNDARSDRVEPDCPTCLLVHTDAFVYVNISMVDELRVMMVSIPRELYLHVEGITDSQVSQLYARGGLEWIKLWSEAVLGVEIDGVMAIDMEAFVEVIDRMGGISVRVFETFEDKCGDEWYEYIKGEMYDLDGNEALCFTRMRMYNPRGYFARQERHTEVLRAVFAAMLSDYDGGILEGAVVLVSAYFEYVETDMSPELIARIVSETAISWNSMVFDGLYVDSISQDMLELYPRSDENSPYLYQPTFVISEWVQCLLESPFECEVE